MKKTKKILIAVFTIVFLIVAIMIFIVIPRISNHLYVITHANDFISTSISLSDIDEEYIEEYNPRTQRAFDILHYNIKIDLFPEEEKIKGDVTIKIKVNDKSRKDIELNFHDNLKIRKLTLNESKSKFSRKETNLIISSDTTFTDTINVRVVYEGTPRKFGFGSFSFDKSYNKPLVYSLSEPVFASTWFPCIDVPDDKALADIYITNDSSFVSLSNGKLISTYANANRKTYYWKTYYPISTYLIAIYSGDYKTYSDKYISLSGDTLDLYCYATPKKFDDAVKDFSDHKSYLRILEELFGEYAFPKEKYSVAEFGWNLGAMEHQTITGLGSKYISGRKFFQDMIIHELAHHWWGNAVGLKTWKDIWLNEGFSTYSEALYWEKKSGYDALQSTLQPKFGEFKTGTLYNPKINMFIKMVYDKGAWVLHMLRKEVGDRNFFNIMRAYYKNYKYKNASTDDFKMISEKISGKNLKQFFDQWVYLGVGIIDLEIKWSVKKNNEQFNTEIYIKQLQNGYDIYKFPIDIKFIYEDTDFSEVKTYYVNNKEETFLFVTRYKPQEIVIDPDKWLLAKYTIAKKHKLNDQ